MAKPVSKPFFQINKVATMWIGEPVTETVTRGSVLKNEKGFDVIKCACKVCLVIKVECLIVVKFQVVGDLMYMKKQNNSYTVTLVSKKCF